MRNHGYRNACGEAEPDQDVAPLNGRSFAEITAVEDRPATYAERRVASAGLQVRGSRGCQLFAGRGSELELGCTRQADKYLPNLGSSSLAQLVGNHLQYGLQIRGSCQSSLDSMEPAQPLLAPTGERCFSQLLWHWRLDASNRQGVSS
jgi:hypothetical protein